MKSLTVVIFLFHFCVLYGQSIRKVNLGLIDTTNLNIKIFAGNIAGRETNNLGKAKAILNWVSNSLEWMSTDYNQRTVKEILARGGGNCFEIAKVYMAFTKSLDIKYRLISEINIQPYSANRQKNAEQKVKQNGNQMSVFGGQYNDHRWVEVYDSISNNWIPVDPTMNVIGVEQWLSARVWFGNRVTLDTNITNSMIVPIAIFVTDMNSANILENRSEYYLVEEFDKLYNNRLSKLSSWKDWIIQIEFIQNHIKLAFEGKENLHNYNKQIAELEKTYQNLKAEYSMGK